MPNGGLIVSVVIEFEENAVWVDHFISVEPGGKDLFFEELFVGISDGPDEEKGGYDRVDESD